MGHDTEGDQVLAAASPISDLGLPFAWDDWSPRDYAVDEYRYVTFVVDFGVWQKGHNAFLILIDPWDGSMKEIDESGEIVRRQGWRMTAMPIPLPKEAADAA